ICHVGPSYDLSFNWPTFGVCQFQGDSCESGFVIGNFDELLYSGIENAMGCGLRFSQHAHALRLILVSHQLRNRDRRFYDFREGSGPMFFAFSFTRAREQLAFFIAFDLVFNIAHKSSEERFCPQNTASFLIRSLRAGNWKRRALEGNDLETNWKLNARSIRNEWKRRRNKRKRAPELWKRKSIILFSLRFLRQQREMKFLCSLPRTRIRGLSSAASRPSWPLWPTLRSSLA